jgi:phosphatidylglycerol---prolipoprotein diacylglyceryl transferase
MVLVFCYTNKMTFPVVVSFGSSTIPVHPIFEFLAFFISYRYFLFLKKKNTLDPLAENAEWWIIAGMAFGAFFGSRLIAALEHPYVFLHPPSWTYYIGAQTIAGGLVGGILGVEITKKILKVKRKTGDLFIYPLLLGIIIGRVGCLLTGVRDGTVGLSSNLPWAFDQGDGISRHPTSLYEILFIGLLWFLLKKIQKRSILKEGDLFSIFVLMYALFRFFVEYVKPRDILVLGLTSIQLLTGIVAIYYIWYLTRRYNYKLSK